MKPTQEQIAEAAKRGIIEGATIRCVCAYEDIAPVPNPREWDLFGDGGMGFRWEGVTMNRIYIRGSSGRFATVITPAPSKEEGLKEGDACECSLEMKEVIVAEAKARGIVPEQTKASVYYGTRIIYQPEYDCAIQGAVSQGDVISDLDFLKRLRVTTKKPKPIKIGEHTVEFKPDGIKVGCTSVDFATLEAVYNKAKEQR